MPVEPRLNLTGGDQMPMSYEHWSSQKLKDVNPATLLGSGSRCSVLGFVTVPALSSFQLVGRPVGASSVASSAAAGRLESLTLHNIAGS